MSAEPFIPQPEFVDPEGNLRLPLAKFWQWRALEAEVAKYNLESVVARQQYEDLVKKIPELVRLREKIAESRRLSRERSAEYREFQKELAIGLGVELQNCVIDDETGLVKVIE